MSNTRIATFRIDGATRDEDGFLRCDVHLSKTGVFDYEREDGGTVREFRSDSEVFSPKSLKTYLGKPVTIRHPSSFVGPSNYKLLSVGNVTEAREDAPYVAGQLLIHDSKTIGQIESGELTEISMGYRAEIQEGDGERYDAVQTNIRVNHCALLGSGESRLGSDVGVLRLDSKNNVVIDEGQLMTKPTDSENVEDKTQDAPEDEQAPEGTEESGAETEDESSEEEREDNPEEMAAMLTEVRGILTELVQYVRSMIEPEEKTDSLDAQVEARVQRALKARTAFSRLFSEETTDGLSDRELAIRVIKHVDPDHEAGEQSVDLLVDKASLIAAAVPENRNDSSSLSERLGGAPTNTSSFRSRLDQIDEQNRTKQQPAAAA